MDDEDYPEGLVGITDRLVIRELKETDIPAYYAAVHSCGEGVADALLGSSYEDFYARHMNYIKYQYGFYGYGNFGVFLKVGGGSDRDTVDRSDRMIGIVGLVNGSASRVGEMSWGILPEYRRMGYASEACREVMEFGRECGFESFEARIGEDNTVSMHLADRLGIQKNIIIG